MPAFGKSGTLRILAFRSVVVMSRVRLSDRKAAVEAARRLLDDVAAIDARGGRPAPKLALEAIQRFDVALGERFDRSARQVANPAVDAFARRRRVREVPEAHALYPSADQEASRAAHAKNERLYWNRRDSMLRWRLPRLAG